MEDATKRTDIFVDDLSEDFICTICHGVLTKASSCKNGHVYCEECIHQWLQTHKNCPSCRKSLSKTTLCVNRVLDNLIGKLQVRCINGRDECTNPEKRARRTGTTDCCEWTGNHCDLLAHVASDCKFVTVDCVNKDNGCHARLLKSELEDGSHVCPAVCQFCNQVFPVGAIAMHKRFCDMVTIKCTNVSCKEEFLRKGKSTHEAVCPHAVVECPFAVHGCKINGTDKLARSAMGIHQAEAAMMHSLLMTEQLTAVKKRLDEMEKCSGAKVAQSLIYGSKVKVSGSYDGFEWLLDWDALKQLKALDPTNDAFIFSDRIVIPSLLDYEIRLRARIDTASADYLSLYFSVEGGHSYPVCIVGSSIAIGNKIKTLKEAAITESGKGHGWRKLMLISEADARAANGKLRIVATVRASVEVDLSSRLARNKSFARHSL
jgi:hypothetical protein